MLNTAIYAGRLAPKDRPNHLQRASTPRSGTLSRKELQKIIEDMLG